MNQSIETPVLAGIGPARLLLNDVLRAVTQQAIVAVDADGTVVCCNDTARRLHGRPPGQPVETWRLDDLYGPPLSGSPAGRHASAHTPPTDTLLRRMPASGVWTGPVECTHASGGTTTADMVVTQRRGSAGVPGGLVLAYRPAPAANPVTDSAPPRPARPSAPLPGGTLLSKLGHELRSPLNGIIGLTRILLTRLAAGSPDPQAQTRQLTLVQTSAHQMLRTIEQVVDIARLQAGPALSGSTRFDCARAVADTVQALRPAADARGHRLHIEVPAEPVLVAGDARLLDRLLNELVGNAVTYADPGDIRIRVRVADDIVTIEVANDGPAIPADERSRIFEAFERGDAAVRRDDGSAGLGLYLASDLAQRLDATLSLDTGTDPGVTFTVTLPRRYAPAGR